MHSWHFFLSSNCKLNLIGDTCWESIDKSQPAFVFISFGYQYIYMADLSRMLYVCYANTMHILFNSLLHNETDLSISLFV